MPDAKFLHSNDLDMHLRQSIIQLDVKFVKSKTAMLLILHLHKMHIQLFKASFNTVCLEISTVYNLYTFMTVRTTVVWAELNSRGR